MKRTLAVLTLATSFAHFASAGSLEQKHEEDSPFSGQAIAIGWAAESCKGNELSDNERKACAVLEEGKRRKIQEMMVIGCQFFSSVLTTRITALLYPLTKILRERLVELSLIID